MFRMTVLAAATAALMAGPALAQNLNANAGGGKGLVVVDISALNNDQDLLNILQDANIEVLNDNTVQVPINVAATICEVEVNAIASSNDRGQKSCPATVAGVEKLSG